jgi:hypothetical protein
MTPLSVIPWLFSFMVGGIQGSPAIFYRFPAVNRHPWPCITPGETLRNKPTQGRSTYKSSVVRRGLSAAYMVPPPRRRASPSTKTKKVVFAPAGHSASLHFLWSQTLHQRLKGGGTAPGPRPGAAR